MLVLSHSQIGTFLECQKKYQYIYIDKRVPARTSEALAMGRVWANLLEMLRKEGREKAINYLIENSENIEETIAAKICAMFEHYKPLENMQLYATEMQMITPIFDGTKRLRNIRYQGRIDAMYIDDDNNYVLNEDKTTSEKIIGFNAYWQRLAVDHQLMWYCLGTKARKVIYNVVRKPQLRLKQKETVEEYQQRMTAAIAEDPELYYQRRPVIITEEQVESSKKDLASYAYQIRDVRKKGAYPRNTRSCRGMYGMCQYLSVCTGSDCLDDDCSFADREFAK